MEYAEWLELRKNSIGGSDAGAIMQYIGEWGSPLTVYLNKKGIALSKEMSVSAMRGKLLEIVIRARFGETYPNMVIEKVPYILYSPEFPFMSANLDGIIAGPETEINGMKVSGIGGLEIKTTKSGYGFNNDEIPDGHYCQVQHYMAVTGISWFVLAAYFLEDEEIKYYVIKRNDDFIKNDLIPAEKDFWENYILKDEWPAAVGIDSEEEMFTGMFEGGATLALGEKERELCREYVEAHTRFKEAEDTKKRISITLKEILVKKQSKNGEKKISAIAGKYSISWSRYQKTQLDTDAIKKAGLYDRFAKTSESGALRITEKKGS
jgi:putative phage-type endonuclease